MRKTSYLFAEQVKEKKANEWKNLSNWRISIVFRILMKLEEKNDITRINYQRHLSSIKDIFSRKQELKISRIFLKRKFNIQEMALIINSYSVLFLFFFFYICSFYFTLYLFHLWHSRDGANSLIFTLHFYPFLIIRFSYLFLACDYRRDTECQWTYFHHFFYKTAICLNFILSQIDNVKDETKMVRIF